MTTDILRQSNRGLSPAILKVRVLAGAGRGRPAISRWMLAFTVVAMVAAVPQLLSFTRGVSLVARASGLRGPLWSVLGVGTTGVSEQIIEIPLPRRTVRGRLFIPTGSPRQTVLLTPGLQPGGIDDARLTRLAGELAKSGVMVLTPDFPELSAFEIAPSLTDGIADAALWLATQPALAPDGRIGLIGVSFSAGLTVVAAGRPALRPHVSYVLAFGGHDDLPRVLRYLATGHYPSGSGDESLRPAPAPHDYGLAVLLLGVAERVVPPDQVTALRAAIRQFINACYLERQNLQGSREALRALRETSRGLPEPSRRVMTELLDRDTSKIGARLLAYICFYGEDAALSPSRSPRPAAPVFLLHGTNDSIIPAAESQRLARRLQSSNRVRLLLTGAISHAEMADGAHLADVIALARFWGAILDQ